MTSLVRFPHATHGAAAWLLRAPAGCAARCMTSSLPVVRDAAPPVAASQPTKAVTRLLDAVCASWGARSTAAHLSALLHALLPSRALPSAPSLQRLAWLTRHRPADATSGALAAALLLLLAARGSAVASLPLPTVRGALDAATPALVAALDAAAPVPASAALVCSLAAATLQAEHGHAACPSPWLREATQRACQAAGRLPEEGAIVGHEAVLRAVGRVLAGGAPSQPLPPPRTPPAATLLLAAAASCALRGQGPQHSAASLDACRKLAEGAVGAWACLHADLADLPSASALPPPAAPRLPPHLAWRMRLRRAAMSGALLPQEERVPPGVPLAEALLAWDMGGGVFRHAPGAWTSAVACAWPCPVRALPSLQWEAGSGARVEPPPGDAYEALCVDLLLPSLPVPRTCTVQAAVEEAAVPQPAQDAAPTEPPTPPAVGIGGLAAWEYDVWLGFGDAGGALLAAGRRVAQSLLAPEQRGSTSAVTPGEGGVDGSGPPQRHVEGVVLNQVPRLVVEAARPWPTEVQAALAALTRDDAPPAPSAWPATPHSMAKNA